MPNPYKPSSRNRTKRRTQDKPQLSFPRRTAIGIWAFGFALQLAAYIALLAILVVDINSPYVETASSDSAGFNPDLAQVIFNLAIGLFGLLSIFGIIKCRDFTREYKWSASIGSTCLFGFCWLCFMFTAIMIAFSGGFQGE